MSVDHSIRAFFIPPDLSESLLTPLTQATAPQITVNISQIVYNFSHDTDKLAPLQIFKLMDLGIEILCKSNEPLVVEETVASIATFLDRLKDQTTFTFNFPKLLDGLSKGLHFEECHSIVVYSAESLSHLAEANLSDIQNQGNLRALCQHKDVVTDMLSTLNISHSFVKQYGKTFFSQLSKNIANAPLKLDLFEVFLGMLDSSASNKKRLNTVVKELIGDIAIAKPFHDLLQTYLENHPEPPSKGFIKVIRLVLRKDGFFSNDASKFLGTVVGLKESLMQMEEGPKKNKILRTIPWTAPARCQSLAGEDEKTNDDLFGDQLATYPQTDVLPQTTSPFFRNRLDLN